MRVDALALKLRPRPMWEAADLGVRMAQANAGDLWRSFVPVWAAVLLLSLATVEIASWLPSLLIFWLKPWLDRSLLFVLSRAAFGQRTGFMDLWQAQRQVWWSQGLRTLTLRRLSPWRAFTQPIHQLEGQEGAARRQRRRQFLNGQGGAAMGVHAAFAHIELVLALGLMSFVWWFAPQGMGGGVFDWLTSPTNELLFELLSVGAYALVVLLLEPFYVAAGFAMYLNRRVQLEAWDIEQEFRHAF
jgi:hypothetical protein